jgi:hypothetical protein
MWTSPWNFLWPFLSTELCLVLCSVWPPLCTREELSFRYISYCYLHGFDSMTRTVPMARYFTVLNFLALYPEADVSRKVDKLLKVGIRRICSKYYIDLTNENRQFLSGMHTINTCFWKSRNCLIAVFFFVWTLNICLSISRIPFIVISTCKRLE